MTIGEVEQTADVALGLIHDGGEPVRTVADAEDRESDLRDGDDRLLGGGQNGRGQDAGAAGEIEVVGIIHGRSGASQAGGARRR